MQKPLHIWGKVESDSAYLGKEAGSEKTLNLYPRLILGTETAYNIKKQNKTKSNNKNPQTLAKSENLISRFTTLSDSDVQALTTTNHRHTEK